MGFFDKFFNTSKEEQRKISQDDAIKKLQEAAYATFGKIATSYEIDTLTNTTMQHTVISNVMHIESEQLCKTVSQLVENRIVDENLVEDFVLQEIKGASIGNEYSKLFAKNSGYMEKDYYDSLDNEDPRIDGAGGPQQFLNFFISPYLISAIGKDEMVKIRVCAIDKIMQKHYLGKYR